MVRYDDNLVDELPYFRLALFVGYNYFKAFAAHYPDDLKQVAALAALRVGELDTQAAYKQINQTFVESLRNYGFATNMFSEWYIPEIPIDYPSYGYSILKVHSLDKQCCSISGCNDEPVRWFPRYGRVCNEHSNKIEKYRKQPEAIPGSGTKTFTCYFCKKRIRYFQSLKHYARSFCSSKCYEDQQREDRRRDLSIETVREIKAQLKAGKGQRTVAREFGIPRSSVINIDSGRWYSEVLA